MATGRTCLEVSEITGYSRNWIYRLVGRYNTEGTKGLGDQRKRNIGRESLLDDVDQAQLWQLLHQPAPDGGLWNSRKLADWLSDKIGRQVSRQRGWEYLQQMDFRLKVPRPSHRDSCLSETFVVEKKLSQQLAKLQSKYPQADIEVWCSDEQRLGLQPKGRRVWTQLGEQPVADVKTQYQWLWLYGFLHPESGETYFWILPQVNTELFNRVLTDLAREFDLNQNKRILLVLDQAGWHTTNKLVLPEGIDLFFLPSHSPELQPAEGLWPLTNEAIKLRFAPRSLTTHQKT